MNNSLSVIIINFNQQDLLRKCLSSLEKILIDYEIIVVDNNSANFPLVEFAQYDNVRVICNNENYGYGKACNIGAKAAQKDILFFLNPDTELIFCEWSKLFNILINSEIGLVFPSLFFPNHERQFSCRTFYNFRILFARKIFSSFFDRKKFILKHYYRFKNYKKVFEVDWGLGGAFLVSKKVFFKLNGFDERFFLYFEDVDFAYRSKINGYKNIHFPYMKIIHHHQRQSRKIFSKSAWYHFSSLIKFIKKWGLKF